MNKPKYILAMSKKTYKNQMSKRDRTVFVIHNTKIEFIPMVHKDVDKDDIGIPMKLENDKYVHFYDLYHLQGSYNLET